MNGTLFETGNFEQLADKIIFLLNNPKRAALLADALYEKVKRECNCETYFERLEKIYDKILD